MRIGVPLKSKSSRKRFSRKRAYDGAECVLSWLVDGKDERRRVHARLHEAHNVRVPCAAALAWFVFDDRLGDKLLGLFVRHLREACSKDAVDAVKNVVDAFTGECGDKQNWCVRKLRQVRANVFLVLVDGVRILVWHQVPLVCDNDDGRCVIGHKPGEVTVL